MDDIERLKERLEARIPDLLTAIDKPGDPANPQASSWLDLTLGDYTVAVECKPGQGFGFTARDTEVYGEGPDEICPDVDSAFERLTELLLSQGLTSAPVETILKKLRESRSLSQNDLASLMHVHQAAGTIS